jgi:hypothetical protein
MAYLKRFGSFMVMVVAASIILAGTVVTSSAEEGSGKLTKFYYATAEDDIIVRADEGYQVIPDMELTAYVPFYSRTLIINLCIESKDQYEHLKVKVEVNDEEASPGQITMYNDDMNNKGTQCFSWVASHVDRGYADVKVLAKGAPGNFKVGARTLTVFK